MTFIFPALSVLWLPCSAFANFFLLFALECERIAKCESSSQARGLALTVDGVQVVTCILPSALG